MPSSNNPLTLKPAPLAADAFAPFGQVITARADGERFGPQDAQLDLGQGTPRFYIMRLSARALEIPRITRHRRVTQCLASVGGKDWWLVVAPPGDTPTVDDIRAFTVPGDVAVKLHVGTWHAGPYFAGDSASFFNLELADTNQVDHDNLDLMDEFGCGLRLAPASEG
ncbi:hypothetical protein CAI21_04735 [Alkalilimnicola ehrlichii]|uniref:Ureidoglycolate hydrolase n=1 Tax=Alkalilimnicola ehrlichii TaxID=351052 RepID=A0A3E0X1S9_9GAMM|nr:ureidoglycolate lyase [Alkalilimnicola ehrlichii]RFA30812.1 hypothetical protein CAI21_04735 [Alkalilimnicola ehrlichii]RFA38389.1 hypothetical protein CAL65_06100 [Alkalilimnicola ehrlichii]